MNCYLHIYVCICSKWTVRTTYIMYNPLICKFTCKVLPNLRLRSLLFFFSNLTPNSYFATFDWSFWKTLRLSIWCRRGMLIQMLAQIMKVSTHELTGSYVFFYIVRESKSNACNHWLGNCVWCVSMFCSFLFRLILITTKNFGKSITAASKTADQSAMISSNAPNMVGTLH